MKISLISIIYKNFVYGLFVYLFGILDLGYLLGFVFRKCKYAQLHIFFSKSAFTLHSDFTSFAWLDLIFRFVQFKFIGFLQVLFQLHFVIVSVTLASLSYFNISKSCVCFLFQFLFLFFHFELYVVVNVIVGMTAFGHLITQSGFYIISLIFLKSLVSLIFNLHLLFVSMFQYHSSI